MIIWGITLPGLIRFFTQFGFAIAGAVSLWGFIFMLRSRRRGHAHFEKFCAGLVKLYIFGLVLFLVGWALGAFVFYPSAAAAHEGIRLLAPDDFIQNGFRMNLPLVILLLVASFLNLRGFFRGRKSWNRYSAWLWLLQFLVLTGISVFTIFTGSFDRYQLFHAFHNWHSILTLGTVLVVDFLVLATKSFKGNKDLYDFFHVMSSLIWVGLGLDFLSNLLIFEEGFVLTPQFFFSQTVVAILILNGALLSGRITDALGKWFRSKMINLIYFSGAVSITSWLSITFVDFFRLTLVYWQLMSIYVLAIAAAYCVHHFSHRFLERSFDLRRQNQL